jgi:hypothetical protein
MVFHSVLTYSNWQSELEPLPAKSFPCYTQFDCMVASNAIITVKQNRYSVPSCFIGHRVQIHVLSDSIELWHAAKKQFSMPRLVGEGHEFGHFSLIAVA